MKTKRYRTSKNNNYVTYDDLEQLGFGSWLKDNAGNLIQGAAGAGMMFIPGMQVAGAGMLAGSASGFANTAIQKNKQEATEKAMQNQQALTAQRNRNSIAEAPISFVPTMKCGGRLKRMAEGGELDMPNFALDPVSIVYKRPVKKSMNPLYVPPAPAPKELDVLQHYKTTNQEFATDTMPAGKYHTFDIRRISPEGTAYYDKQTIPDAEYSNFITTNADVIKRNPNYSHLVQKADGGTINYNGQLHSGPDGGVPVDGMGNPNPMNPVALVEKGEVSYNNGENPYVFSDKLEQDKKKTFAKRAKEIQKKYKMRMADGRIIDPIAKAGYDKEMQSLIEAQETKRRELGLTQDAVPQAANGGGLPKYGGTNFSQYLNLPNLELPANVNMPQIVQNSASNYFNPDFRFGQEVVNNNRPLNFGRTNITQPAYSVTNAPTKTWRDDLADVTQRVNQRQEAAKEQRLIQGFKEAQQRYNNRNTPTISLSEADIEQGRTSGGFSHESLASKEYTPYEGMSGWEAAIPAGVSALSNVTGMLINKERGLPKMKLPPVVARRISLEQERQNLREQGALARTMNRRGLAESGASQAQLMSGTTAGNIGVQRNLNEGLVQLGTTEAMTNLQSQQRADEINSQQAMQEQAFNSQLELGKQSQQDQYLMNAMTAPMLGMQDYLRSKQDAAKIQMSQPNVQLMWERDPQTGKRRLVRREVNTGNILDK